MNIPFMLKRTFIGFFLIVVLSAVLAGCVATRNWVREQMDPLAERISKGEARLSQTEGSVENVGQRLSGVDGKLGEIDARTEKALAALANLRLEKRLVLDLKEGTNFAFNSAKLPLDATREIDGFLSDLRGDPKGLEGTLFVIAGHTDSTGSDEYNYELGRKRAESVARYLITQKKVDPLRIATVSYGKEAPVADNSTREGRAKNRRTEILVYRETITSTPAPTASQAEAPASSRSDERFSSR